MRISKEDRSREESNSIQNQRDLLYDFIRSRQEFSSHSVLEFCDDGYSGMNFQRPGIQKLLSLAGKTITCMIVKDFSRFGRNLIEVGNYLDQVFPFLGVRFIAVNEGYDSKQAAGSSVGLEVSLKAMISELYSRDISEKIRSVQRVKMQKGEYLCGIAFYGYQRSQTEKNKLELDPYAAQIVGRIFGMAAEGMTPSKIAARLNQEGILSPLMYRREKHTDTLRGWNVKETCAYWTRENVRRILLDERYTGCLISRKRTVADLVTRRTEAVPKEEWIIAKDSHTAIVSEDIFRTVQKGRRCHSMASPKKTTKTPHPYVSHLIKCAYCKRPLRRTGSKKASFYCASGGKCSVVYLEESVLGQVLSNIIQFQSFLDHLGSEVMERVKENITDQMQKERKEWKRCKTLQIIAFEDYTRGHFDKQRYLLQKQKIKTEQEKAEVRLSELSEQLARFQKKVESIIEVREQGIFIKEWKWEMLAEFVEEIWVTSECAIAIRWSFAGLNTSK